MLLIAKIIVWVITILALGVFIVEGEWLARSEVYVEQRKFSNFLVLCCGLIISFVLACIAYKSISYFEGAGWILKILAPACVCYLLFRSDYALVTWVDRLAFRMPKYAKAR